jgi:hypothetical protein
MPFRLQSAGSGSSGSRPAAATQRNLDVGSGLKKNVAELQGFEGSYSLGLEGKSRPLPVLILLGVMMTQLVLLVVCNGRRSVSGKTTHMSKKTGRYT